MKQPIMYYMCLYIIADYLTFKNNEISIDYFQSFLNTTTDCWIGRWQFTQCTW